jgi:hypothetical protein
MLANIILLALNTSAGQTPDVLDIFRTQPSANILLLLDSSCSMGPIYGRLPTTCSWFGANYNAGSTNLSKNQAVRASLIGCTSATDGVLDKWAGTLNFSVAHFGNSVSLLAPFGSTSSALQTAVNGLAVNGSTPMTLGLRTAGNYLRTAFNNTTHPACRKDYIVMMSDGEPNGGNATFNYECTAPIESLSVSATQPWNGSRYLYREPNPSINPRDSLCTVTGVQPIRTYTVGFEALEEFDEETLQRIATDGNGTFFHATDITSLSSAFESIVTNIVSRGYVGFTAPSVQTNGLFADNYVYATAFKPALGIWPGSVKKFCVSPAKLANGRYDTAITNCIFRSTDGTTLITNSSPQDLFTFISSASATSGGTGQVLFSQMGAGANGTPVAPYWGRRNILTWRDGGTYVPVEQNSWRSEDTWANGCDHKKLMNFMHGYTYDANCTTGNPVAMRDWTLGAAINSSPVLLKYGPCHTAADVPIPGNCYVASGMNDGMLHFFDAATGRETSALVPSELWKPNRVSTNMVDEMVDQPVAALTHRYYVDGNMRLLHDDTDGDSIIDSSEDARLVFGLGRGGYAYYQVRVSTLASGLITANANPVYPLYAKRGTAFEELRETWHAPYFGRARINGNNLKIAAFGSGHIHTLDEPTAIMGSQPVGLQADRNITTINNVTCSGASGFAAYNGLASNGTNFCTATYRPTCLGTRASPCYDTGYWSTNPATTVPMNTQFGPLRFATAGQRGAAYRLRFNRFGLGTNDILEIKDAQGRVVYTYSGAQLNNGVSDWIYDEDNGGFYVSFSTNGIDSLHVGFDLASIDWVPFDNDAAVAAHNPTLFVVDNDKWNGPAPRSFTGPASGAVVMRVARNCNSTDTGTCIDQTRVPALAQLVCPITAEVSAYTEGDTMRALYFGTECGEIWKLFSNDGGFNWDVRRILALNTTGRTGQSKNFRKIMRKLDIVPTTCSGTRSVGIYFGTGNEQRPQAQDELADIALNDGRDVVGVVWDNGLINDLRVTNLQDITATSYNTLSARTIAANGRSGWYMRLPAQERMLRDPLVFEGVAYFKTRQPTSNATECTEGSGTDVVYAVNNCNGDAVRDSNGDGTINNATDRTAWSGTTDIGANLLVFTPKNDAPILSIAPTDETAAGRLNTTRPRNVPRVYQWRQPTRD